MASAATGRARSRSRSCEGARAADDENGGGRETAMAEAAAGEAADDVVFAFFKPKPMITDLTKGGMGEVARAMAGARAPMPKPVGQLDRNTTGLMIFTSSGRLTEHLNNHVSKTYRVWYLGCSGPGITPRGELTEAEVQALLGGVFLEREKVHVRFDSVRLRGGEELPSIRLEAGGVIRKFSYSADVSIHCGVFHVVKRLFDSVGKSVSALQRIRVSGLRLEDLPLLRKPGDFCELSREQQGLLWEDCQCRGEARARAGDVESAASSEAGADDDH